MTRRPSLTSYLVRIRLVGALWLLAASLAAMDASVAQWIGVQTIEERSPLLRREFEVRGPLLSAHVSFTAIGAVELYLNGTKVGDEIMTPAPTQFEKRALVSTYDITAMLKQGSNVIGAWLNEGQAAITRSRQDRFHNGARQYPGLYAAPAAWIKIELLYQDGVHDTVVTDSQWKWSSSPLTYANFYGGESYDARLEQPDWNRAGFDDRTWRLVEIRPEINIELSPRKMPPMRVVETLKPVASRKLPGGIYLFDLGQNIAGFWRIKVRGKPGWTVSVRGSETLDNSLYRGDFGHAQGISSGFMHGAGGLYERDTVSEYTMKGEDEEVYTPRFFYSGFRYIQVEVPDRTALQSVEIEGCVVHTDVPKVGSFRCSDERLNRLHQNTVYSIKGIMQGAPMSNPNSEKNGWTGDAHLFAEAANSIFVMDSFWDKWLTDLRDAQEVYGRGKFFPQVVPTFRAAGFEGPATAVWGAAYPLVAWYQYRYSGDAKAFREHYEPISRWAEYLASTAENGLVGGIWADHNAPGVDTDGGPRHFGTTPNLRQIFGTGYYALTERILSEMATILGRSTDAAKHLARAVAAENRINEEYFDASKSLYVVPPMAGHFPLQAANLVPLQLNFAPVEHRARILEQVLRDIRTTHGGHLMTGIVSTKAAVEVLIRERKGELLYQLATQPAYPGWGFWLANGATTHWQSWMGKDAATDQNHAMFGVIEEFLSSGIAGIVPPTETGTTPGWKHIRIAPMILSELSWAEGVVPTPQGLVRSRWQKDGAMLILEVDVPSGSTATLEAPAGGWDRIEGESGTETLSVSLPAGSHRLTVTNGQLAFARRP